MLLNNHILLFSTLFFSTGFLLFQILPHVKSKQSDEMSKTQLISVVRNQIQEASRVLVNVIQDQLYVKNVITDVHAQVS